MGDMARLKREFGDRLSFCGAIDTPGERRRDVRRSSHGGTLSAGIANIKDGTLVGLSSLPSGASSDSARSSRYMDTISATLARHKAFWNRAEVDRPLLRVKPWAAWPPLQIPVPPGVELPGNGYLSPEMLDPMSYFEQVARNWDGLGPTDGDLFRVVTPYWYVPWLEAICGCPIRYFRDSGTMYSEPPEGGWDHICTVRLKRDDPWLVKLREFYVVLRQLAAGRYPIGVAMPMRGPIDLLGAIVGTSEMCLAFAERPRVVQEALAVLTDLWIEAVGEQVALAPPFEGGMAGCEQYGLWAPGTNAVTQCDLAVTISPRMYSRFLVPCDETICASLDYPIIHLHSAAIHVLEPVLSVTGFAAIQVVVDPGPTDPPLVDLIPYFQKVQRAGKPLLVHCGAIEQMLLDTLLAELSPRGLCVEATIKDPGAS
jgi:hypothetical protein